MVRDWVPGDQTSRGTSFVRHSRIARVITYLGLLALVLMLMPSPTAAQTPAAAGEDVVTCATSQLGYSVKVCLTTPGPDTPITTDPLIQATVEIDNPDIHIRAVVFVLDGRNILSDFDPAYAFTLPLSNWADGEHTLSSKVRLSDDNESTPVATKLLFRSGTETPAAPESTFAPALGRPAAPGAPFVVAAVGDGAGGSPESQAVTSIIGSWNPNLFLYLGDVYNSGTVAEFANWYAPDTSFGRFKAITNPTIGNHEYGGAKGPQGYMQYWGNPPHYYSVTTNGWHIVSLDTNEKFNETDLASEQMQWLQHDLESSASACTLVFFHQPRYSVGSHGDNEALSALWGLLAQHHVTLVLTGHDHNYQRWQPLDGQGAIDPAGIVSLVVGSGGQSEYAIQREDARLAVPPLQVSGALRMELNPNGASMQFMTTDGVVRDSSVVGCGGANNATDSTPPTAPHNPSAERNLDGTVTVSWTPGLDDTGIAAYDIYRNGDLIGSVPPASNFVDQPGAAQDEYAIVARDEAGNVSEPSATARPEGTSDPTMLFTDDFGSGSLGRWSEVSGLTIERSDTRGNGWLARARGGIQPAYARITLPTLPENAEQIDLRVSITFCLLEQGSNPAVLLRLRSADGISLLGISISETGMIGLFNDLTASGLTGALTVTTGDWHELTAEFSGTQHNLALTLSLDGQAMPDLGTTLDLQEHAIGGVQLGDSRENRVYDIQYRDITIASGPPAQASARQTPPSQAVDAAAMRTVIPISAAGILDRRFEGLLERRPAPFPLQRHPTTPGANRASPLLAPRSSLS